jgi:ADP-ribosyl-[dinitrogen reductase] hydrolase
MIQLDTILAGNPEVPFLHDLQTTSTEHDYFVYQSNSDDPDVVLIGDFHPHNIPWFADDIEAILLKSVQQGDAILMEGAEGRVIYRSMNMEESPIFNIKNELDEMEVKACFNDSVSLLRRQAKLQEILQVTYENAMTRQNKSAASANKQVREERDHNFVYGPLGIANHQRRIFQVVGMTHLLSGGSDIVSHLERENLSYAVVLPVRLPTDNSINAYVRAIESYDEGTREEKCEAIKTIRKHPIRRSMHFLHHALTDRSGRVRKYAAQALGKLRNQNSIGKLMGRIDDNDILARWTIHNALSRFTDNRSIDNLTAKYLSSNDREKWTYAALLLGQRDTISDTTKIYDGLNRDDPFIRALAIRLVGKTKSIDLDRITLSFHDENSAVREEAVRLIAQLDPTRLAECDLSQESDPHIVAHVDRILGVAPRLGLKENKDKVKGSLYGAIIGDALGCPVESMRVGEIKKTYGLVSDYLPRTMSRGVNLPAGAYTDDGELTLENLASILERGAFDPFDISMRYGEIGRRIDDDFDTNIGYGFATLMAFRKLYVGVNWRFTGNKSSGCGAAMRAAPIALLAGNPEENLITQSKITHLDPLAIGGAMAIGYAINKAYDLPAVFDPLEFITEIADHVRPISPILATEIGRIPEYLYKEPHEIVNLIPFSDPEPKRKGKGALGTVPFALYSFLRSPKLFEETAVTAVNYSNDSDSVASMACAISGAYNGFGNIPERYINNLHQSEAINNLIESI